MAKKHDKIELTAQKREVLGSGLGKLREDGFIPGIVYGKGLEPIPVQVPSKDFKKVLESAGESTLVYLNVGKDSYPTIIHDVSRDPLKDNIIHADFYKVNLDEKIKAMVPVQFEGESPAVKDLKGIFVRNANELEVEALPQDLPHEITIDVTSLKAFGDQILAKDLKLPPNVKLSANDDDILATVQEPISEEELKADLETPTTDVSAVEEIKKEKAEEPSEGGEAESAKE
jgi:large subunit ribosomal protein L25